MGLLSGYLIVGSLKESIDFDSIKDPEDIVCMANANKVVENYKNFYYGSKYLIMSSDGSEFASKNKENFDTLKERFKDAPEELTKEDEEDIIDDIEDLQRDEC